MATDDTMFDLSATPLPYEDVGAVEWQALERRAADGWKAWGHASASQVQAWRSCRRLWALEKVGGLEGAKSANLALGSAVHAHLERWLVERTDGDPADPAWQIATAGQRFFLLDRTYLPTDVERPFALVGGGLKVPVVGSIDLVDVDPCRQLWRITDHKTVSGWRYAKTEEQLRHDVQGALYATAIRHATPTSGRVQAGPKSYPAFNVDAPALFEDGVLFRHVQYRTKAPYQARAVEVLLEQDATTAHFAAVVQDVAAMAQASKIDPREQPPTLTSCGAYGGCPRRAVCSRIDSAGGGGMSQLDLLSAQPVAAPPPPPPPPPRPKPMPVVEEARPADLRAGLNPPGGTAYEAVGVLPAAAKAKRKPAKQAEATAAEPVKVQTQPEQTRPEQTQPEQTQPEPPRPEPVKAESGHPSPAGFDLETACVLLVGCWARKGLHHRDVQEVVSEIAALLAKRAGVEHYCSGAPNEYRNPYRALAAVLAKRGLPPGVWTLDPAAPWAPEVLEVLRSQAIIVIEAAR